MWLFDQEVRSRIFGFKGVHSLYRAISCNVFIPNIYAPTLVITAKDDPITKYKCVPLDDLKRNPNIMTVVYGVGGHCDFFERPSTRSEHPATGKKSYQHFVTRATMEYFE